MFRTLCLLVDSVFGCDLTKLVEAEGSTVPKFLIRCMEEIEKRGIYHLSYMHSKHNIDVVHNI